MYQRPAKVAALAILSSTLGGFAQKANMEIPSEEFLSLGIGSEGQGIANFSGIERVELPANNRIEYSGELRFVDAHELFAPLKVRERPTRSNYSRAKFLNIYVPGMARSEEQAMTEAAILARHLADSVYVVENFSNVNAAAFSGDLIFEAGSAALSSSSPRLAEVCESRSIISLLGFLAQKLNKPETGGEVQVRLIAHSEGAAIVKAAIRELSNLCPTLYEDFCRRGEVLLFGSPIHYLDGAVECQPRSMEFAFSGDPVCGAGAALLEYAGSSIEHSRGTEIPKIEISSAPVHAFSEYIRRMPEFIAADIVLTGKTQGVSEAAQQLFHTLREGRYADHVCWEVIDEICSGRHNELAREIANQLFDTQGREVAVLGAFRLTRSQQYFLRRLSIDDY